MILYRLLSSFDNMVIYIRFLHVEGLRKIFLEPPQKDCKYLVFLEIKYLKIYFQIFLFISHIHLYSMRAILSLTLTCN